MTEKQTEDWSTKDQEDLWADFDAVIDFAKEVKERARTVNISAQSKGERSTTSEEMLSFRDTAVKGSNSRSSETEVMEVKHENARGALIGDISADVGIASKSENITENYSLGECALETCNNKTVPQETTLTFPRPCSGGSLPKICSSIGNIVKDQCQQAAVTNSFPVSQQGIPRSPSSNKQCRKWESIEKVSHQKSAEISPFPSFSSESLERCGTKAPDPSPVTFDSTVPTPRLTQITQLFSELDIDLSQASVNRILQIDRVKTPERNVHTSPGGEGEVERLQISVENSSNETTFNRRHRKVEEIWKRTDFPIQANRPEMKVLDKRDDTTTEETVYNIPLERKAGLRDIRIAKPAPTREQLRRNATVFKVKAKVHATDTKEHNSRHDLSHHLRGNVSDVPKPDPVYNTPLEKKTGKRDVRIAKSTPLRDQPRTNDNESKAEVNMDETDTRKHNSGHNLLHDLSKNIKNIPTPDPVYNIYLQKKPGPHEVRIVKPAPLREQFRRNDRESKERAEETDTKEDKSTHTLLLELCKNTNDITRRPSVIRRIVHGWRTVKGSVIACVRCCCSPM